MKEGTLNAKLQKRIKDAGGYVIKTIATNRAGVPDIIGCLDGKFIAIEGKTAKGVVSQLQLAHLDMIKKAGGRCAVVRSVAELDLLIKDWLK